MVLEFQAKISNLSQKGMGVAKHPDGRLFFVRGVWPGEVCDLKIVEKEHANKKYGFASLQKIITVSPNRQDVPCPHFGFEPGQCSGCPWLFINYEEQLREKEKKLCFMLDKNGFENIQPKPIKASEKNTHYRNRCQLKTDGQTLGFVTEDSHHIAPIDSCLILNAKMNDLVKIAKEKIQSESCQPEKGKKWKTIDLDDEMDPAAIAFNKRRPFKQGNSGQNLAMKGWLTEKLSEIDRKFEVLELFCGNGNFTKDIVSRGFKKITVCEVNQEAINSLLKQKYPVNPIIADLTKRDGWEILRENAINANVLVLDPPREGLHRVRELNKFNKLQKMIYISCNSDSFIRDCKALTQTGWEINEIQPIDLFPQTPHIELLTVLTRKIN